MHGQIHVTATFVPGNGPKLESQVSPTADLDVSGNKKISHSCHNSILWSPSP